MAKMVAALLFAALVLSLSPSTEATYATVKGSVVCKEDWSPVPGIPVTLDCKTTNGQTVTKSGRPYTVKTDNKGNYNFGEVAGTIDTNRKFAKCTVTIAGCSDDVSNNGNVILKQKQVYTTKVGLAPGYATCPNPSPPPSPPPPSPPPPSKCPVAPPAYAYCPNNAKFYDFKQTRTLSGNNKAQYRFTAKLKSSIPIETVATVVLPPGTQLSGQQCKTSDGKDYPSRKLLWYCNVCVDEYTNTAVAKLGKVYQPKNNNGLAYDITLTLKGAKGSFPPLLDGALLDQCGNTYH